jgi:hypothetical protein
MSSRSGTKPALKTAGRADSKRRSPELSKAIQSSVQRTSDRKKPPGVGRLLCPEAAFLLGARARACRKRPRPRPLCGMNYEQPSPRQRPFFIKGDLQA